MPGDGPSDRVEYSVGNLYPHRLINVLGRPGDQEAVAGCDDARRDGGNLVGSLSRAKDYFGKPLPDSAVVVDAGEAQVLERGLAYKLKEPVLGGLRRKRAALDGVQKRAEIVTVHCPKSLAFVDFAFSRAVKSAIVPRGGFIFLCRCLIP